MHTTRFARTRTTFQHRLHQTEELGACSYERSMTWDRKLWFHAATQQLAHIQHSAQDKFRLEHKRKQ